MRLATLRVDHMHHVAVLTDDGAVDLVAAADAAGGAKVDVHALYDLTYLLAAGDAGLAEAARLAQLGTPQPLDQVELGAPLPRPNKLLLLAGNYAEHIMEGGRRLEEADKATPRVFMKPPSTTIRGPFDPIPVPPVAQFVDWEAELAFVIGRECKGVKAADGLDYVAGYTVINDVSERELKIRDRAESRPIDGFFDWLNGKWLDGFAPMGPWLTTADEVPDPHALEISLTVNGTAQQRGNTGQMIFHIGDIIEYISTIVTLEPGDVVATGTCAGVGHAKGIKLQPGDVVAVEVAGLGRIENTCIAVEK